jgi:glutathione S-transferase
MLVKLFFQPRNISPTGCGEPVNEPHRHTGEVAKPKILQPMMLYIQITIAGADKCGGQSFQLVDDIGYMQVSGMENAVHGRKRFVHLRPQVGDGTGHVRIRNQAHTQALGIGKLFVDGVFLLSWYAAASTGGERNRMILIGRYLSPFVRRSATLLNLAGVDFEQKVVMTDNVEELSQYNPLVRVPALQLDNGEILVDSHAIIDYVLSEHDPDHALCPPPGADRRHVMYISGVAVGAMEKLLASAYERSQRPKELVHEPYRQKVLGQAGAAFAELERLAEGHRFYGGKTPNLADVNAVVAYDFGRIVAPQLVDEAAPDHLAQLASRADDLTAFAATKWENA